MLFFFKSVFVPGVTSSKIEISQLWSRLSKLRPTGDIAGRVLTFLNTQVATKYLLIAPLYDIECITANISSSGFDKLIKSSERFYLTSSCNMRRAFPASLWCVPSRDRVATHSDWDWCSGRLSSLQMGFNYRQRLQFSYSLQIVLIVFSKSLSLRSLCSDQHVNYRMPSWV